MKSAMYIILQLAVFIHTYVVWIAYYTLPIDVVRQHMCTLNLIHVIMMCNHRDESVHCDCYAMKADRISGIWT
jgi:hypothetical protein